VPASVDGARPVVVTDAPESPAANLRRRQRLYAILMAVHLAGLLAAAVVFQISSWLALGIVVLTGALPWVAVVLANDSAHPRRAHRQPVKPQQRPERAPPAVTPPAEPGSRPNRVKPGGAGDHVARTASQQVKAGPPR
jgi:hypothetical protein